MGRRPGSIEIKYLVPFLFLEIFLLCSLPHRVGKSSPSTQCVSLRNALTNHTGRLLWACLPVILNCELFEGKDCLILCIFTLSHSTVQAVSMQNCLWNWAELAWASLHLGLLLQHCPCTNYHLTSDTAASSCLVIVTLNLPSALHYSLCTQNKFCKNTTVNVSLLMSTLQRLEDSNLPCGFSPVRISFLYLGCCIHFILLCFPQQGKEYLSLNFPTQWESGYFTSRSAEVERTPGKAHQGTVSLCCALGSTLQGNASFSIW